MAHRRAGPRRLDAERVPLREIAQADGLVRENRNAAAVLGLEPMDGEAVVEKQRMSAFNSTTLDTKPRGLGARAIVFCGAWTNFAIERTCRDGADHGYEVVLATDGTATISDAWQEAALTHALTKVAELRTVDEIVSELQPNDP